LPHRGCHFNCQRDVVLDKDNFKSMIEIILIITFIVAIANAISVGYNLGKSKRNDEIVELEFDKRTLERVIENLNNKNPSK